MPTPYAIRLARWLLAFLPAVCPCLALSQPAAGGGIRVFEHAYYVEFDPVTALDMVNRTPGFNPQEQSGGRGLGGVRSNILINGKRPPPKGQSIWQQLSNRLAGSVTRIELIPSAASNGIDMQGYDQVVNVVMEEELANYYELNSIHDETGDGDPLQRNEENRELNLITSLYRGPHELTLRGGLRDAEGRSPAEFVGVDPANPRLRMSAPKDFTRERPYLELSSLFALPGDRSLSMSAEMNRDEQDSSPAAGAGAAVRESSGSAEEWREVSAEFRGPMGDGHELMVAVLDSRNEDVSSESFAAGDDLLASRRERGSGETAGRVRWNWQPDERLALRSTLSTAFNYFEGSFSRFENGVPQAVAGSDSRVQEDRHSLAVEADWKWREGWTLRGSFSAGSYRIDTRDRAGARQPELQGWISAAYQVRDRTTITAESRYDIGQLSLSQFLASSNLSSDIVQAGAVSLRPERTREHTLRYDQRFGDRGVLQFTLGHRELLNPIRTVALSDSLIVSQNTFSERRTWFDTSLEYPFERFGWPDLMFEADLTLADSGAIDPVSLEPRPVSWVRPMDWSLGLRKNPGDGQWSWGVNLWKRLFNGDYWVRETREQWHSHEWNAFLTYEIIDGLRLTARAESPRNEMRVSRFFPAVRRAGLDPYYNSLMESRRDIATSLQLQWRRQNYLELTATINPRPAFRAEEWLSGADGGPRTALTREIARGPAARIQIRLYNR